MKLAPKDVGRALTSLKQSRHVLLAYGPDAGGVRDLINRAKTAIADGGDIDPLSRIDIGADTLSSDPARLHDEAAQQAFFGGPKFIDVGPVTDAHIKSLEYLLMQEPTSYVFVSAGNLPPKSKVRQLFEKAKNAYAAACYLDAERDIDALIDEVLSKSGVRVSRDARLYLRSQLGNDRSISRRELEKLALFCGVGVEGANVAELTMNDVRALVGSNSADSLDDLASLAFSGLGDQADSLLQRALRDDANAIEIVRALARRSLRLSSAADMIAQGKSSEAAMKSLRPPVFWKDQGAFSAQLSRWQSARLDACLSLIVQAEIVLKGQSAPQALTLGRLIMQISMAARRQAS